jgi:hypothetical protein
MRWPEELHQLVTGYSVKFFNFHNALAAVRPKGVVHVAPRVECTRALAWTEDRNRALVVAHPAAIREEKLGPPSSRTRPLLIV